MNGGDDDQALGRSRGGFGTKIHLGVEGLGLPVSIHLSPSQDADITHAETLLGDLKPDAILADKGYDSDAFVQAIEDRGAEAVIPPKKNRVTPRNMTKTLTRSGTKSSVVSRAVEGSRPALVRRFGALDPRCGLTPTASH